MAADTAARYCECLITRTEGLPRSTSVTTSTASASFRPSTQMLDTPRLETGAGGAGGGEGGVMHEDAELPEVDQMRVAMMRSLSDY